MKGVYDALTDFENRDDTITKEKEAKLDPPNVLRVQTGCRTFIPIQE